MIAKKKLKWYKIENKLPDEPRPDKYGVKIARQYLLYMKSKLSNYFYYKVSHFFRNEFLVDILYDNIIAWCELPNPPKFKDKKDLINVK